MIIIPIPFLSNPNNEEKPLSQKQMEQMRQEQMRENIEGAMMEGRIKGQVEDAYEMSPKNPQNSMPSYYEKTQLTVYDDEMALLRALLQGKIEVIKEGKRDYVYPEENLYEVGFTQVDENNKPHRVVYFLPEDQIDERYMEMTGRMKKRAVKNPLCNPAGQRDLLNFAAMRIRGSTALSIYSAQTIAKFTMDDGISLAEAIYINMDRWGIDPDHVNFLVMTICDRIDACRRRAVDGRESELPSKNLQITHVKTDSSAPRGLPLLGNLHNQKAGI